MFDHVAAFVIGALALAAVARGFFLLTLPKAHNPYPPCYWPDCNCPTTRLCREYGEARELIDGKDWREKRTRGWL